MIVGIDPGLTGAIAVIGERVDAWDIPVLLKKVNAHELREILRDIHYGDTLSNIEMICIEQVNAMPGQGVTSMFNFGKTVGSIDAVASLMKVPIVYVRPAKWKKDLGLIRPDLVPAEKKELSRQRAIELYPEVCDKLKRKKDNGRAEALLIALWAEKFS